MSHRILVLALAVGCLLAPAAARATVLVNDPAAPFPASQLAQLQRWVNGARVLTPPGAITVTDSGCPNGGYACSSPTRQMWLDGGRETLLHELGHEWYFLMSSPAQTHTLEALLHMTGPFEPGVVGWRSPNEVAADAYMECAMHKHWVRWWAKTIRHHGWTEVSDTPTSYEFQAGRTRFARICAVYR